jgi:hypothetical protein
MMMIELWYLFFFLQNKFNFANSQLNHLGHMGKIRYFSCFLKFKAELCDDLYSQCP